MSTQPPSGFDLPGTPGDLMTPAVVPGQKYTPPPRPRFDYTGLIKDGLKIVWRHKFLWFFGLFAYGNTTSFGGYSFNGSSGSSNNSKNQSRSDSSGSREVSDWISTHVGLIIAVVAAIAVIGLLLWLWSIVCRGAVIGAVADIRAQRPTGFRSALAHGRRGFGRLLLLDLLLMLIMLGIMIIMAAVIALFVFVAVSGDAGETIVIVLLSIAGVWLLGMMLLTMGCLSCFTIWFVFSLGINLIIIYATRAVVLDGARPMEALRRGWRLLVTNLNRSLLLYLLSTGLGIVASICAVILIGLSSIPAIISWIMTGTGGWSMAGITLSILLTLIPVAVSLVVAAVVNTYFSAFWTISYRRMTGQEPSAALLTPQSGMIDSAF
ncbi:MAG: DUF7544 domain-containing protein [Thermoleophilia bacterium]